CNNTQSNLVPFTDIDFLRLDRCGSDDFIGHPRCSRADSLLDGGVSFLCEARGGGFYGFWFSGLLHGGGNFLCGHLSGAPFSRWTRVRAALTRRLLRFRELPCVPVPKLLGCRRSARPVFLPAWVSVCQRRTDHGTRSRRL